MVVPSFVIGRLLRRLYGISINYPVPDELRGWSWSKPPLRPRAYLDLSINDVASYCPTRRDVWLRRVRNAKPEDNSSIALGRDIHEVISKVIKTIRRYVVNEDLWGCSTEVIESIINEYRNKEWFSIVRDVALTTYYIVMGDYSWYEFGFGHQPLTTWVSEVRVDGSLIGLSRNLKVDAIVTGNLIIDFKVGRRYEVHDIALTAYALALEANNEVPINYGFLVYIQPNGRTRISVKPIYIGPDLRRDFIDFRDEVIDLILSEKEPPKATSCPQTCPYRKYCYPGVEG